MDLMRLHTDEQTPQSPADGLDNAAAETLETGTEMGSEPTSLPPEPPANLSKHVSLEINSSTADSDGAERFSLHPEPAPKEGDVRRNGCCLSSGTICPLLSQMSLDLIPPSSDIYSENTDEPPSTCTYLRSSSQESDSLGSDTAAAPITELYIFESETQDFILSSSVEPPRTGGRQDVSDSSVEAGTRHPGSGDRESHECQQTSATVQEVSSVNDEAQGSAGVSGGARRGDSPVELWLDACQYLTAEDADDRDVLDETGASVTQEGLSSDVSFPSEETWVSRYDPDRGDGIGCFREDTRGWGPPVERWSSVDSWESALSHWSEIVTAPPEDITAAFTEIGAEIDALTQALAEVSALIETGREGATEETQPQTPMGVQDKPLDTQNIPESSILSGHTCRSFHLHSSQTEDSAYPTDQHSSVGSSGGTEASPGGYSLIPGCAPGLGPYVEPSQGFKEDQIILNIIEDTDVLGEDAAEEPPGDGVCEVTDAHTLSQPVSLAKQEAKVDCDETEASTDPVLLHTRTLTRSHVAGVDTELGTPHVTDHTEFDGEGQVEPQWGGPRFIMPLAPLRISSPLCQTSGHLEGAQICGKRSFNDNREHSCDHVRPPSLLDDKENTADSAGTSPPGGQPDLTSIKTSSVSDGPPVSRPATKTAEKMPHKAHKNTSESKGRSKKEKPAAHHHGAQAARKQEGSAHHVPAKPKETHVGEDAAAAFEDERDKPVSESVVPVEKAKLHGKKKKKHGQSAGAAKSPGETPAEESSVKPKTTKGRIDMFEAKMGTKAGKAQKDNDPSLGAEKNHPEAKPSQDEAPPRHPEQKANKLTSPMNEDAVKRRRLSQDKFGKLLGHLESKLPKSGEVKAETPKAEVGAARRKAYSDVVRQTVTAKEDPRVAQPVQAASVSGDPQGLCLWCQFAAVVADCTVSWRRDGAVLAEIRRSAGDESRVSLTISNASHKDLGRYECCLRGPHGAITLDYLLTYEVLSEIVIPPSPKSPTSVPAEVGTEEEDVQCSRLMFKEDFLSDQYFDPVNHPVSIVTEKAHFGEGMHRRAFRTKLQAGRVPLLLSGHSCVLKVHNSISYGTKNNDELVQKNFTLAVEECQVQNTAREYIKAYTAAAQSVEAFGETPEIIPIYLVHRPSNDIPYATLEEELIGDFVKYSVKDGKEINLMRRDSEAGRKCCAFQHWVYHKTEGNLLVTDMQGVGMKLTDVGIATCKKGYKGFKGNCATSFIDQFKALHQCNNYCEILGLKSLQPKPRKPAAAAPKARAQPAAGAKKKGFGPPLKGKS